MANTTGAGRPTSTEREAAILAGDKTYYGAIHKKCGGSLRYTKGSGCVHCARNTMAIIRDAAKQNSSAAAQQKTSVVDKVEPAAYEQDIDSLM